MNRPFKSLRPVGPLIHLQSGSTPMHTIWVEVVVEQGRQVQNEDILRLEEWVEDVLLDDGIVGRGSRAPETSERQIFAVSGNERPNPDITDDETGQPGFRPIEVTQFSVPGGNRIHVFIRFSNTTLQVSQLDAVATRIRQRFKDSDVGIGRGLNSINVVDGEIVRQTAPEHMSPYSRS